MSEITKDQNTSTCSITIPLIALTMEPNGPLIAKFGPYTISNDVINKQCMLGRNVAAVVNQYIDLTYLAVSY